MKRRGLIISWWSVCLVLITGILAGVAVCVKPTLAQPKKITLRIIYEQPITDRGHTLFKAWQERVNAAAPERLQIQYLGAYEVIPTFEQMDALKKGTVDMAVLAPSFYTGALSEAMAFQLIGAKATVPETRKVGMVDLQDKIHRAKLGVAVLGGLWAGDHHVILLKKPVTKADLSGLKIRGVGIHLPALRLLGAGIVSIPPDEVYTGLQTGLLDGTAGPTIMVPDYRFEEVTNYIFLPFFPTSPWVPLLVRAQIWDGLPGDVKKIIMDPLLEQEQKVDQFFINMEQGLIDKFIAKGMQKCGPTSRIEVEELLKKMMRSQWKTFIEDRADPVWLPKLNQIAKPVLGID